MADEKKTDSVFEELRGDSNDSEDIADPQSGNERYSGKGDSPNSSNSGDLFDDCKDQDSSSHNNRSSDSSAPNTKKCRSDEAAHSRREDGKSAGISLDELRQVTLENCRYFYVKADKVTHDMSRSSDRHDHQWNQQYVRMPYTSPPTTMHGHSKSSRWNDKIQTAFKACQRPEYSRGLKNQILSYNEHQQWDFSALENFLDNHRRAHHGTWDIVARMAQLASRLLPICPKSIPLLRKQKSEAITLTRLQIGCLLCNAFFCTFPMRNTDPATDRRRRDKNFGEGPAWAATSDIPILPSFNFSGLFKYQPGREKALEGKLQCLFNYFDRITKEDPEGCVTFERLVVTGGECPNWSESNKHFRKLHVRRDGFIEDEGSGMLQVDFANKRIGGGVLGRGCVQEEIRFVICPELIVSRLFTEELDDNETLLMTGCERYNKFTGYGDTFDFDGNYNDTTPRDSYGRCLTQVVAMDAEHYRNHWQQFTQKYIDRELKKAYCGFRCSVPKTSKHDLPAVATGNWGCGAFKGDRHLKALIQLMAAAEAGRDVLYITIDDNQLVDDLSTVHKFFTDRILTVGRVYRMIRQYSDYAERRSYNSDLPTLIEYILNTYKHSLPDQSINEELTSISSSDMKLRETSRNQPVSADPQRAAASSQSLFEAGTDEDAPVTDSRSTRYGTEPVAEEHKGSVFHNVPADDTSDTTATTAAAASGHNVKSEGSPMSYAKALQKKSP